MLVKPKKFDIIAIGGATRDIMFYSSEGELVKTGNPAKSKLLAFEYGAKLMMENLFQSFGGGAANAAASFASLGLKTAVICRVGDDENGEAVIKNFRKRGVDASYVAKDKKAATGFSVIITADNSVREHVVFTHRGANDDLSVKDLCSDKITADWLYVSSLPKIGWDKIMEVLIKTKKNIAWNPGNTQLKDQVKMKKLLKGVNVLVINRDEAMEFKKLKNIKSLIKYIHDLGAKIAVITDGENGAYAYDAEKYYFMKARSAKAVDTVGVGDAFSAAFTSALVCGKNIKEALSWGMRNSASVVSRIGAQNGVLTRKQITRK